MASELPTILSAEGQSDTRRSFDNVGGGGGMSFAKIVLILFAVFIVIVITGFLLIKSYLSKYSQSNNKKAPAEVAVETEEANLSDDLQAVLPSMDDPNFNGSIPVVHSVEEIEYLSFSDFYKANNLEVRASFEDYTLPINTKIDVINYHDTARKLKLDGVIDNLNNNGFAIIDNPWSTEAPDFYSTYAKLRDLQIPLFISSDLMVYYQQNIMKKLFKSIEENVFYDHLWSMNKELFYLAETRYDARLKELGNINDPLLEAARLETVFFAVSLELLKPLASQIAPAGMQSNNNKFSASEASHFVFSVPNNIKKEVEAELALIRAANKQLKSPVLLYNIDYNKFKAPSDYKDNAKLKNFYIASVWLNSLFPLYYQGSYCPDCLLDREDWRISMLTATLISEDFASSQDIKNSWARIYKVLSFFQGLRDEFDYLNYQESMTSLFGDDYNINEIFSGTGEEVDKNIDGLAAVLAKQNFLDVQGGWSAQTEAGRARMGFKILADFYSPEDYLLSNLAGDKVGVYNSEKISDNNTTTCSKSKPITRCVGSVYDLVNLVYKIPEYSSFYDNFNYSNYQNVANSLKQEITVGIDNHLSSYWSVLSFAKKSAEFDKKYLPIYSSSEAWSNRLSTQLASTLTNISVPFEQFNVDLTPGSAGVDDFSNWNEYSYVEPNLALVDELIALNKMVADSLAALNIQTEIRPALEDLKLSTDSLEQLKQIMVKEIEGEDLIAADYDFIFDFSGQLKLSNPLKDKRVEIDNDVFGSRSIVADISKFKLIVVVNNRDDQLSFSVGPVWQYLESIKR